MSDDSREGLWEVGNRVTGLRWEQDVGDGRDRIEACMAGGQERVCETAEGIGSLGLQGSGNGELKALGRNNYNNMK